MASPQFQITQSRNLISVELAGIWQAAQDLAYLTELSEHIAAINHQPWGLLINMRNWQLDDVPRSTQIQDRLVEIPLDRRNQLAECWIVNNDLQGRSVMHFVTEQPGLSFERCYTQSEALAWLKRFDLTPE